jgi:hypothetical protein
MTLGKMDEKGFVIFYELAGVNENLKNDFYLEACEKKNI